MQFVQYECIKSELKDEYDKKINFLHKRLNKKALNDPSFFLMNSMTDDFNLTDHQNQFMPSNLGTGFAGNAAKLSSQNDQNQQFRKKVFGGGT